MHTKLIQAFLNMVQGLAKYSLKTLRVLVTSTGCFESTIVQGMDSTVDAMLNVLEEPAIDKRHGRQQVLQLRAIQVK